MKESKNILEAEILMKLDAYHALGEIALFDLVRSSEVKDDSYSEAIGRLVRKNLVEVVKDPKNLMNVVRLKVSYQ